MIKLVPRPQYYGLDDESLLQLFCKDLDIFESEPDDGDECYPTNTTTPSAEGLPNTFSSWVRKVQLMIDEINLTVETHNISDALTEQVNELKAKLKECISVHRNQSLSEDDFDEAPDLYDTARRLANEVEADSHAQDKLSTSTISLGPEDGDMDEEDEFVDEDTYMAEQLVYCTTKLNTSQGEVTFNAVLFYSPTNCVTTEWIKQRYARAK